MASNLYQIPDKSILFQTKQAFNYCRANGRNSPPPSFPAQAGIHHPPSFPGPFDKPFDKLKALSEVEGLMVLSEIEGLIVLNDIGRRTILNHSASNS